MMKGSDHHNVGPTLGHRIFGTVPGTEGRDSLNKPYYLPTIGLALQVEMQSHKFIIH